MIQLLASHSAAERIASATEFVRSFPAATELVLIGASRDSVDDLVRGLARSARATLVSRDFEEDCATFSI